MKILAFLQNPWFKNPRKAAAIFAKYPDRHEELTARYLFCGCKTGRILRQVFGQLCDSIVWCEASPQFGTHSSSAFPACDLLHLNHVADPPNPDVAVVDAILVQRAMLAPNPTSANARINHVDHSTVGVANRDTDLLPTFPLRMGHPDGAFAIDDACKPAEPLIVSHCRKWMNRSERRPDSFHVNQNTRRNLLANYKTRRLFCGGGLGASGWHGRAWEYLLPSPTKELQP